jgi:hypothetical protein
MNGAGLSIVIMGVYLLIYSVLCRNKVTPINRSGKMVIFKLKEFLKLQLYFSIIDSLLLVIYGIIVTIYNVHDLYPTICFLLLFFFIYYLLKIVSKRKGYINYN